MTGRELKLIEKKNGIDKPYVLADDLRIREIIVNILSNAVKYTNDGGTISFTAETLPGADENHIVARYIISDTGIGMSEEFLSTIFDEFTQEDNSIMTQYKGTGLGMAITKKYVDLMGGNIAIKGQKGVGSTFTVEIPLELSLEEDIQRRNITASEIDLTKTKVLIVEDNDLNAEIAVTLLEEHGMKVQRAVNGQEAVDIFSNNPPGAFDVILMDIMMPVLNEAE